MKLFSRWKLISAVSALLAVYGIAVNYSPLGAFGDDIRHLLTAESILSGSYRDTASPSNPLITNQLPGYPLLLAIPTALGSIKLAQWQSVFFTAGAALLIFLTIGGPAGALAAALTAFNPLIVMMSGTLMSEPAFLFWTMTSLYMAKRFPHAVLPVLLWTAFGAWIRPQGLLLLIVFLPHIPRQVPLKKRLTYPLIAFGVAGLPFVVNLIAAGTPASYFQEIPIQTGLWNTITGLLSTLRYNAIYYFKSPLILFAEPRIMEYRGIAGTVSAAALWFVIIKGFLKILEGGADESQRLRCSYAAAFLLAHLFWVNQDPRYLLPVLPFLYETAVEGLSSGYSRRAVFVFASFSLASGLFIDSRIVLHSLSSGYGSTTAPRETVAWVTENTKKSDLLMASDKYSAYFFSGRKAAGLFYSTDPDGWYRKLLDDNIRYVWLENPHQLIKRVPSAGNRLERTFKNISGRLQNPGRFRLVFCSPSELQWIYEVTPPAGFTAAHDELIKAREQISSGELAAALKRLKDLAWKKAPLIRLDFYLGTTAMLLNETGPALSGLRSAVQLEPQFATAWKNLGRIYEGTGKKKEAAECFSKAENLTRLP